MQDLERYVRFDLAPGELDAAVTALVAGNNRAYGRTLAYPRVAVSAADFPPPRPDFLPMAWRDPGSVTAGYFRGEGEPFAWRILVDEGRSRIYLYQGD